MSWRRGNQRLPVSTTAHSSQKSWVKTEDIVQIHEWVPGATPSEYDFQRYFEIKPLFLKITNDRV